MRKIVFCLLLFFTGFCFAQGSGSVDLDIAISNSVREIKTNIPAASVVAVYNFDSPSDKLSKYIANAMIQNISNNTSMRVVERDSQNESLVEQNISYASSGNISDNSVYQKAKKLGAQFVIYGSFEQYGSLLQLTVRVTNVETGEIPVVSFSFIQKTKKIENLLGSSLVLESSSDYMEAIASCISKLESIKADNKAEINNVKSKISSEYQSQINEVKSRPKDPWLNQSEHQSNIEKDVKKIETERDTKISGETESINIKYSELLNNVENEIITLKKKLEVETFILRNGDVKLLMGEFIAKDDVPKHWPYSIESMNENINYKYDGKCYISGTDTKTEYLAVENVRTTTGFIGEIAYQVLVSDVENSFDVKILNVKILYPDGRPLRVENIDKIITKISAVNKNIVTQKNTTKQTVVKTETTSVNTRTTKAKTSNKEKTATNDARVNDIFGIGYCTLTDGNSGIYLNALSSSWDNVFVNWLNFVWASGEYSYSYYDYGDYVDDYYQTIAWLLGIDCGYTFRLWKLFPFIKGGLYYGCIDIPWFNSSSQCLEVDWAEGLFIKLGVGTDLKFNNYFKMFTNLDAYMCMTGDFFFGFNFGLSVGKPAKK